MLHDNQRWGQGAQLAGVLIRRLTATDWGMFRDVRLAALRDAPDAFGSSAAEAERLRADEWRRRLTDRAAFLAEVEHQGVGVAAGITAAQPSDAELISMWVAPAWRGRGVGYRLVEAVLGWAAAEGFSGVRLWVAQGNARAERLYARHGFTRTGAVQPMTADAPERVEFEMLHHFGENSS
jgi:GNAT superfamily N-acetyltransferase